MICRLFLNVEENRDREREPWRIPGRSITPALVVSGPRKTTRGSSVVVHPVVYWGSPPSSFPPEGGTKACYFGLGRVRPQDHTARFSLPEKDRMRARNQGPNPRLLPFLHHEDNDEVDYHDAQAQRDSQLGPFAAANLEFAGGDDIGDISRD
jgi:hypothetical protein